MYVGKPKEICHLEDLGIDEKSIGWSIYDWVRDLMVPTHLGLN